VGVENYWTKLPKGTPLRHIWSNKSFGVYGSSVVLTLDDGEKKSTRESPLESRYRLYHYGRYRAIVKMTNSLFESPFEGVKGNVCTSSIARWKARGRLPIRYN